MRRLLLAVVAIAALAALAAPAFAYVQTGHLPSDGNKSLTSAPQSTAARPDVSPGASIPPEPGDTQADDRDEDDDESPPTRPVPEPGTMALASMGLLALGAAARRRNRR